MTERLFSHSGSPPTSSVSLSQRIPSLSSGRPLPSKPQFLPAAVSAMGLLGSLERLCSAKRTIELSPHQADTWLASLSIFDEVIVNEAVIRIAHSDDPFPDLGKLVMRCEQLRREKSGTMPQGEVKLGSATLQQLADAWGVKI